MAQLTGRAAELARKFPIGTRVFVSKSLPGPNDWPYVKPEMEKFFGGSELIVVGHVAHKYDNGMLGLSLNTSEKGGVTNHCFSADWVFPSTGTRVPQITRVKKLRRKKKPIDISEEVRDRLYELAAIRKEKDKELEEPIDESEWNTKTPTIEITPLGATKKEEAKPPEPKKSASIADVIGGSIATAFGVAMAKKLLNKNKPAETTAKPVEVQIAETAEVKAK